MVERTKGWKRYTNQVGCVRYVRWFDVIICRLELQRLWVNQGVLSGKMGLKKVRGRLIELAKQRVSTGNLYMQREATNKQAKEKWSKRGTKQCDADEKEREESSKRGRKW